MGKKSRKRATRRDRRKAKQSNWHRLGKSGPKVGHGTGATQSHINKQPNQPYSRLADLIAQAIETAEELADRHEDESRD